MKTKKITIKKIRWEIVGCIIAYIIAFAYMTYSVIGIGFGPIVKKENGNYCRGFDYGFKVCWGDINAE